MRDGIGKRLEKDNPNLNSGLEVGNSLGRNAFGVSKYNPGLALEWDECICLVGCEKNCRKARGRRELYMGIKYCPGLELPKYEHMEYKLRYSAKRNNIFKVGTSANNANILCPEIPSKPDIILTAEIEQPGGDDGGDVRDGDQQEGQSVLCGGHGHEVQEEDTVESQAGRR